MKALLDLFKQTTQQQEFDAIKIALASPDSARFSSLSIISSSLCGAGVLQNGHFCSTLSLSVNKRVHPLHVVLPQHEL